MSTEPITEEHLKEIVKAHAILHGFTDADAQFVPIKDLKVRWLRTNDWIMMDFSDYLKALAPTALIDLVEGIFKGIATGSRADYSAALRRSVGTEKFLRANRDRYLARCRLYCHTEHEGVPDVSAAAARLYGKGIIAPLPDLRMEWKAWPVFKVPFRASGAFRAVIFNTSLFMDAEGNARPIDEDCLDYLVYCGILKAGRLLPTDEDRKMMSRLARAYPDRDSIIDRLFKAGIDGRVFE